MENRKSVYIKKERKKFTIEDLVNVVKTCKSKGDFYTNHREEYNYCNRTGLLKHMLELIPRRTKWDRESLLAESLKYSTRTEWMKNNISSYNTAIRLGIHDECIKHMGERKPFSPKKRWSYESCKEVYSKYNNLKDLRENEKRAISAAYLNGWHKELSKDYIKVPDNKYKWTFDKVKEEALKYQSIKDLAKSNPTIYQKALREDWLDLIIGHMTKGYTKWTIERLTEEASKYPKNKLYKGNPAANLYIKRHKLENIVYKEEE
jgi:hypothetical protein